MSVLPFGIVVDVDVGLVRAVGPRRDLGAEAARGIVDHVLRRRAHGRDAVARDDLLQPAHAELRRADLRAQVAHERRRAVVAPS